MSHGCAPDAFCVSGSRASGSSAKNFGPAVWTGGTVAASRPAAARVTASRVIERPSGILRQFMMLLLERRVSREHEGEPFVAPGHLDAQRSRRRTVQAEPDAVIALQAVEIQIRPAGRDLAGVVEERGVEEAVDQHPPLGLQQQAVAIAEAPAREPAQTRSSAH